MKVTDFLINITSDNPERLQAFYRDVIELPGNPNMGEGALQAGGAIINFDTHSQTSGPTKEPQRVLINFFVEDLAAEQARLEAKGVKFIRTAGKEWWGGVISTFPDPDGNYCQLIEYRPG